MAKSTDTKEQKTKQVTHPLTDTQQAQVRELIEQARDAENKLRFFLGFVVRDAKLPATEKGYSLSPDGASLTGQTLL